jgi:hypothetical protein
MILWALIPVDVYEETFECIISVSFLLYGEFNCENSVESYISLQEQ